MIAELELKSLKFLRDLQPHFPLCYELHRGMTTYLVGSSKFPFFEEFNVAVTVVAPFPEMGPCPPLVPVMDFSFDSGQSKFKESSRFVGTEFRLVRLEFTVLLVNRWTSDELGAGMS